MKFLINFFASLLFLFFALNSANAKPFDFTDWDKILKKHVKPSQLSGISLNTVNYAKLKSDPIFHRLQNNLNLFSLSNLNTENEKLTFWINVYNILAVKVVTDNYPLKSIKDAGRLFTSVWKIKAGIVGGRKYSLDEIEHGILRKMGDPRIHAAIVCASISCPNLSVTAYQSEMINKQLDVQMKDFLANANKGMRIDSTAKPTKIILSPIFNWFEDDFKSSGGVLNFIKPYVLSKYKYILENAKYSISYMDYNWSINDSSD